MPLPPHGFTLSPCFPGILTRQWAITVEGIPLCILVSRKDWEAQLGGGGGYMKMGNPTAPPVVTQTSCNDKHSTGAFDRFQCSVLVLFRDFLLCLA